MRDTVAVDGGKLKEAFLGTQAAMPALAPQMRILVAVEPVDFRNGIDGLGGVCRRQLLPWRA